MIKKIFIFIVSVFLISCSVQSPKDDEVKNLLNLWYMQQSQGDVAGRWEVEGVTVISIIKDADRKNVFNTTSLVSGTHKHPPLGEPLPDEKFTDTLRMDLEWNGAKWVTAIH